MSQTVLVQLLQRASAAAQRRAFEEVVEICQQVIARFGEEANALMLLGAVRAETGDHQGALVYFERARRLMPSHIHVLANLGASYRAVGRLRDAREALDAAIRAEPRFAIAHNNLGNVLLDLGERAAAKQSYERAVMG